MLTEHIKHLPCNYFKNTIWTVNNSLNTATYNWSDPVIVMNAFIDTVRCFCDVAILKLELLLICLIYF